MWILKVMSRKLNTRSCSESGSSYIPVGNSDALWKINSLWVSLACWEWEPPMNSKHECHNIGAFSPRLLFCGPSSNGQGVIADWVACASETRSLSWCSANGIPERTNFCYFLLHLCFSAKSGTSWLYFWCYHIHSRNQSETCEQSLPLHSGRWREHRRRYQTAVQFRCQRKIPFCQLWVSDSCFLFEVYFLTAASPRTCLRPTSFGKQISFAMCLHCVLLLQMYLMLTEEKRWIASNLFCFINEQIHSEKRCYQNCGVLFSGKSHCGRLQPVWDGDWQLVVFVGRIVWHKRWHEFCPGMSSSDLKLLVLDLPVLPTRLLDSNEMSIPSRQRQAKAFYLSARVERPDGVMHVSSFSFACCGNPLAPTPQVCRFEE